MIVADANVLIALLVSGKTTEVAIAVFSRDPDWIAPPILRSEFRNVLSTMVRRRLICLDAALSAMEEAEQHLEGNEIPVSSFNVLSLSAQSACTAYDCEFVALARALRIPLVTWDRKILAAFPANAVDPETFLRN
jgi:predicted nucleic acid-binding protein